MNNNYFESGVNGMEKIWVKIKENFHAIYVSKENPFLYKFIRAFQQRIHGTLVPRGICG